MVANLIAAFEVLLQFAHENGVIDAGLRSTLLERCWKVLLEVANAQAKHQAVTELAMRFISLLQSCLSSGRAHIASREGRRPPENPVACGWGPESCGSLPPSPCVGWLDGNDIYLDPTRAEQVKSTDSERAPVVVTIPNDV
jgi:hypothetical protein